MANIPNNLGTEIAQKFVREGNTLKSTVKDYAPDRIELEIGDSKDVEFQPQAKIMRWDNETNFSIRRTKVWDNPSVSTAGGKVRFIDTDEEVHIYELPNIGEDGGLEVELHLKTKPATNRFEFSIETKGLDFFYQPALTQAEKDEGVERPENVVGSYAAYHKTNHGNWVGGKEYKTGKAFHIYRPHVTDANGAETWGELEINEMTKELVVTVPQEFLDAAVYPVIVDPTFGYTSIGDSVFSWHNYIVSCHVTPPVSGELTSISAFVSVSAGTAELAAAIYSDSGDAPNNLIAQDSGNITITANNAWLTNNVTGSITQNTKHWLAAWQGNDSTSNTNYFFGDAQTGGTHYKYAVFENWPNPMTGSTSSNYVFSIYAAYAPEGYEFNEYYFDGSDGISDTSGDWTNDASAFDGNEGTYASTTLAVASELLGQGTNAPTTGEAISSVEVRFKIQSDNNDVTVTVFTDGKGETLSSQALRVLEPNYTQWVTLTEPTGGWDWAKVNNLEVGITTADISTGPYVGNFYRGEVRVLSAIPSTSLAHGTYTLSGQAVALAVGYSLTCGHGTSSLTGQGAGLTRGLKTTALNGLYALNGQAIVLDYNRVFTLTGLHGAFILTGQSATLAPARRLGLTHGTFTLTGQAAVLDYNRVFTLTGLRGMFALSGQGAGVTSARLLGADHGTYTLNGQEAALTAVQAAIPIIDATSDVHPGFLNELNGADTSPFSSGDKVSYRVQPGDALPDATYWVRVRAKDPNGTNTWSEWSTVQTFTVDAELQAYVVICNRGIFTLAGQASSLRQNRLISSDSGALTLSGQGANLTRGLALSASAGAFTLSGQSAILQAGRILPAAYGGYTITGQVAALRYSRALGVTAFRGNFILTGQDTNLIRSRAVALNFGEFVLAGQSAQLTHDFTLSAIDSITITENTSRETSYFLNAQEEISITESVVAGKTYTTGVLDTVSITDYQNISKTAEVSVHDSIASESITSASSGYICLVHDTVSVSDEITPNSVGGFYAYEAISVSEDINSAVSVELAVYDEIGASEGISVAAALVLAEAIVIGEVQNTELFRLGRFPHKYRPRGRINSQRRWSGRATTR